MHCRLVARGIVSAGIGCLAIQLLAGAAPCLAGLDSEPGRFEVRHETFTHLDRSMKLTLVTPDKVRTPALLVVFATGDAGWMGASGAIFEHLAGEGYYLLGFSSREAVKQAKRSGDLFDATQSAVEIDAMIAQARGALGLPESTRTIVTGDSRGANFVVFAGGNPTLQRHIAGAVAMALTREVDYMPTPPTEALSSTLQVDGQGRLLTYPATRRFGAIPIAVIQSKGDSYVPAAEARRLFGPDTPTRRLYEVEATNHGFGGGRDELMRDLDDALRWITDVEQARGPSR
jgi:fermentation-respiration switch protein FrsA (DUF1100 family)